MGSPSGARVITTTLFAFHHSQLKKPLDKGRGAGERLDAARPPARNLVEGGHQTRPASSGTGRTRICDESQPRRHKLTTGNLQQARDSGLEHLDATPRSQTKLRHPTHPRRVATNVGNVGPFARTQQSRGRWVLLGILDRSVLLRLNLN